MHAVAVDSPVSRDDAGALRLASADPAAEVAAIVLSRPSLRALSPDELASRLRFPVAVVRRALRAIADAASAAGPAPGSLDALTVEIGRPAMPRTSSRAVTSLRSFRPVAWSRVLRLVPAAGDLDTRAQRLLRGESDREAGCAGNCPGGCGVSQGGKCQHDEAGALISAVQYEVDPGDSAYGITSKLLGAGSRWKELVAANVNGNGAQKTIDSSTGNFKYLNPGDVLTVPSSWIPLFKVPIPGGAPAIPPGIPMPAGNPPASPGNGPLPGAPTYYWTTRAGDFPTKIAQAVTGSTSKWKELVAENVNGQGAQKTKAADGNFSTLYPGDVLTLPASWNLQSAAKMATGSLPITVFQANTPGFPGPAGPAGPAGPFVLPGNFGGLFGGGGDPLGPGGVPSFPGSNTPGTPVPIPVPGHPSTIPGATPGTPAPPGALPTPGGSDLLAPGVYLQACVMLAAWRAKGGPCQPTDFGATPSDLTPTATPRSVQAIASYQRSRTSEGLRTDGVLDDATYQSLVRMTGGTLAPSGPGTASTSPDKSGAVLPIIAAVAAYAFKLI